MTLVTVEQLAAEFNRDKRTVQLLVKDGMPKAGHGEYDLERCKSWYIAYLQAKIQSRANEAGAVLNPENFNGELEQARLTRAKATLAEIELSEKQGRVIPIETMERTLTAVITQARQLLLALPGRIAHELEGETRVVIKSRLMNGIRAALTALSEVKINVSESEPEPANDNPGGGNGANDGAGPDKPDMGPAA
jgi:phage terminase Nu1 subunit (DNA packaging protein)